MRLFSWGCNSYGQLGQGIASNELINPSEVDLSGSGCRLEDVESIIGGGGHTFLLTKQGDLYACGWNNVGQLGAKFSEIHKFTPFRRGENFDITHLSTKWNTCYAITRNSNCIGWGSNSHGQLGVPINTLASTECPIELSDHCIQAEAGLRHAALVTVDGIVMTAGDARKGQLGRPISGTAHMFRPVLGVRRVKKVACGEHHTLALTEDNRLFGWGCNKYGQLGVDPTLHQVVLTPLEIPLPQGTIDQDTTVFSGWTHSALLTGNGSIINWGRNKYGQLGSSSFERHVEWKPEPMKELSKVKSLYLGSEHDLCILDDGVLLSWGWNEHGSCGVGHTMDILTPTCVRINHKVLLAGVGTGHSLAVLDS